MSYCLSKVNISNICVLDFFLENPNVSNNKYIAYFFKEKVVSKYMGLQESTEPQTSNTDSKFEVIKTCFFPN